MVNELAGSWSEKLQELVHTTLVAQHTLWSSYVRIAVVKHSPPVKYSPPHSLSFLLKATLTFNPPQVDV